MPETIVTSKQFTLNLRDVLKGLIMAVLVPVATIITQSIDQGSLTFNWKAIGLAAIGGFVAYLVKNFLSPSQIVVKNPSDNAIAAVKEGKAEAKIMPK